MSKLRKIVTVWLAIVPLTLTLPTWLRPVVDDLPWTVRTMATSSVLVVVMVLVAVPASSRLVEAITSRMPVVRR